MTSVSGMPRSIVVVSEQAKKAQSSAIGPESDDVADKKALGHDTVASIQDYFAAVVVIEDYSKTRWCLQKRGGLQHRFSTAIRLLVVIRGAHREIEAAEGVVQYGEVNA